MTTKTLKEIDPAFDLMHQFGKITKGTGALIQKMRMQAIFSDDAVPSKFKAMAAVLWSVSARCEPCIEFYVQKAAKLGITETELGEFLAVASTMGGCVGEMWGLKAYKSYHDIISGKTTAGEPSCCSH